MTTAILKNNLCYSPNSTTDNQNKTHEFHMCFLFWLNILLGSDNTGYRYSEI